MSLNQHLTTRRGFIAALGFGGVSLYGLWAVYGAAPTPLALLVSSGGAAEVGAHGGGHGAAGEHGPTADEFRAQVADFVERYSMPDGSVYPRRFDAPEMGAHEMEAPAMAGHGTHAPAAIQHGGHGASASEMAYDSHGIDMQAESYGETAESAHPDAAAAVDVFIIAEKWFYEPAHLRLDVGTTYRFRMMAADVSHGASIQFGRGGRMIRLRPNRVTEMVAAFQKPGTYLVYCTVFCGGAHDAMQARIDVV